MGPVCLSYTVRSGAGGYEETRTYGHTVQASRVLPQEILNHIRDSLWEVSSSVLGLFATIIFKGNRERVPSTQPFEEESKEAFWRQVILIWLLGSLQSP